MICSNCHQPVEEGALFCKHCGKEIQWVPDYDTIGNYMEQDRIRKKQEQDEAAKKKAAEAHRRALEAARAEKKRRARRRAVLCVILLLVFIVAGGLILLRIRTSTQNYNDYDYQMQMADTEYSNSQYEKSYEYVTRALEIKQNDVDALLLKAQVETHLDEQEEAVETLLTVLTLDAENEQAYGQLIRLYEISENYDAIKELMDGCTSDDLKNEYGAYICEKPVFSLSSGSYEGTRVLTLYAREDGDTIYYTTDGSEPTRNSAVYTDSITMEEGTTVVKAMSVNEKMIASDVVTQEYEISYDAPDAPQISPSSGTFTTDMDTKIYIIVPDGCRAYYAFDRKPSVADEEYTEGEGIEMPEGTHTIYAILVDSHNKVSDVGSATYTLTDPD